ncbi:tail fiber protein [Bradyrhizobium manausense]|nr:tail fiber protein [Bradyrhizobium manausense]
MIYDATAGTFHILSPVTWPTTGGVPVGTIITTAAFNAPTNYAFAYGQAVNRAAFSSLFAALTSQQTGSLSSGSPIITGLADTTEIGNGMAVEAVGIPAGTFISSCAGTSCTMTANATATRTGTLTFFAYGNGDGSTTFNLPDVRGRYLPGRDNMSGTPANRITSTYYGASGGTLGAPGGSQSHTLTLTELPSGITSGGSIAGTASKAGNFIITQGTGGVLVNGAGGGGGVTAPQVGTASQSSTLDLSGTASVTSNNTGAGAHSILPPSIIVNYAIRLTP